jgi:large subunit ribosomal protein L31
LKEGIHPKYNKTIVTCTCGHSFETRTVMGDTLSVEICSNCHPFYTGKQKLVDTAGRVEKFHKRYANVKAEKEAKAAKAAKEARVAEKAKKE